MSVGTPAIQAHLLWFSLFHPDKFIVKTVFDTLRNLSHHNLLNCVRPQSDAAQNKCATNARKLMKGKNVRVQLSLNAS
jgi:hypothetical protein